MPLTIRKSVVSGYREALKLQKAFFAKAGPNLDVIRTMFDTFQGTGFYITDNRDRLIDFSLQNLDNCNVRDKRDFLGKTCAELFSPIFAEVYMARDREVRRTGRPIINQVYTHGADRSTDLRVVNVHPIRDRRGTIIGTVCAYRTIAAGDALPDWYGRIRSVVAHIDAHYAEKLSIADLAKLAGMSVTHFRRIFLQVMQISPLKYVTTIRINAARKLLISTDKLLTEIAVETGFWDQSHFVKAFKAERGITPNRYRREHWSTGDPQ